MELLITKTNIITTVEQWQQFAPPKDIIKQWKDGKSAKSLAQFMTDKHQVKKLENSLIELGYDTKGVISCLILTSPKGRRNTIRPTGIS